MVVMRRLSRTAVSVALAASLVAFVHGEANASPANAITGTNKPTPIAGQTNGELPANALIRVSENCQTAREAGPSLHLLLKAAENRGIRVGTNECYRPVSGQVQAQQSWSQAGNTACAATPVIKDGKVVGTSMHGWGKAADLTFSGGSWGSAGFKFLESDASRYGWNHPAWAKPGGSPCPEPWHWEWVGDGGTEKGAPIKADTIAFLPNGQNTGYATVSGLGVVRTSGSFDGHGDASNIPINWVMVGATSNPDNSGYWMVGADGGVFSFGNASFFGSTGAMKLNKPVVGMAATPTGKGYWLVASDGGVFSFGDAKFLGSTGGMKLNKPVVGMAPTPDGNGYWLVASDGGIFAFGNAAFYGSTGSMTLNQPVMGMTPVQDGSGYWLVASDGGVFSFGTAVFHGSMGGDPPVQPMVSITRTGPGNGYWMTNASGDVYAFGDAHYFPKN